MKIALKPFLLAGLCLTLALTLTLASHAQVPIARGAGAPTKVPKGTHWYLNTTQHTVWHDLDLAWLDVGIEGATELYSAGQMVIVRSKLGYSLLSPYAEYIWAAPHLRLTDSTIMAWDSLYSHIYLFTGRQLHPEHGFNAQCWPIAGTPQTVQGIQAFCLPDFQAANDTVDCDSLHAYGMFGYNGHWLIAPTYDRAFHFDACIAEVIYDGQKRKINERGEFVD
jgi:hypothetical protein